MEKRNGRAQSIVGASARGLRVLNSLESFDRPLSTNSVLFLRQATVAGIGPEPLTVMVTELLIIPGSDTGRTFLRLNSMVAPLVGEWSRATSATTQNA